MLAFESSNHPHDQSYFQPFSMDACMHHHLNALDADSSSNPFEAYSTFPSDPSPFIVHSSSLALDNNNNNNNNLNNSPNPTKTTSVGAPQPNPSALSPALSASHSLEQPLSSASSSHSAHSCPPSSAGSPRPENWPEMDPNSGFEGYPPQPYVSTSLEQQQQQQDTTLFAPTKIPGGFVDPSLIQPIHDHGNYPPPTASYPPEPQYCYPASPVYPPPSSAPLYPGHVLPSQQPQPHPLPPDHHAHHFHHVQHPQEQQQQQHQQPQFHQQPPYIPQHAPSPQHQTQPQPQQQPARRSSVSSDHSRHSAQSGGRVANVELDDESKESHRCPHPDCGRIFRDLRAHMLTHQSERPEKCPIVTCEYHFKGFARKYDKNRHTLTHYKGTMVCGFCPGSGSAAEKSFNRADVFKRHLTSVHGVDQSPPNCRKKSPTASAAQLSNYCQDATGKCSTCGQNFPNAQDFYEHLDDCVLRVVQQEEPSEAINQKLLNEISSDGAVRETMERHMLTDPALEASKTESIDDDNNNNNTTANDKSSSSKPSKSNALVKSGPIGNNGVTKKTASRRRNNRNNYPPSWGCPTNKMKMKRRVLCLYDGPRRLWKDEMMLDNEFEVRLKLPGSGANGDGNGPAGREAYVTDLDVETLKRAQGMLDATEEEKGPWDPATSGSQSLMAGPAAVPVVGNPVENVEEVNIEELMA